MDEAQIETEVEVNEEAFTPGFKKFLKAMKGHSESVSKILRAHLLTEYFLDQIINDTLPKGYILTEESKFTFSNKLLIVKSLDIISNEVIVAIKNLNRVRNSCSHQMDYNISEADIDLIGRPFGKKYSTKKNNVNHEEENDLLEVVLIYILAPLEASCDALISQKSQPKNI